MNRSSVSFTQQKYRLHRGIAPKAGGSQILGAYFRTMLCGTIGQVYQDFRSALVPLQGEQEASAMAKLAMEEVGCPSIDRLLRAQEELAPNALGRLNAMLADLQKGVPIQYVIGQAFFAGLQLEVNRNVLIPRPETEELVSLVLPSLPQGTHLLDVGTGSGAIACAVQHARADLDVTATDLSPDALNVARRNANRYTLPVRFVLHDILADGLAQFEAQVVVSNPPYIPAAERSEMHTSVTRFEPHCALFVEEPLVFYSALSKKGLSAGVNALWLECHLLYAHQVAGLCQAHGWKFAEVIYDSSNKPRYVHAHK